MGKVTRIVKNALYNTSGWAVSILVQLFVTPYLIHQLGADHYGLYAILHSLIGYIAILDFGLAGGVTKFVAECEEEGRWKEMAQYVGNSLLIVAVAGFLISGGVYLWRSSLAGLLTQETASLSIVRAGLLFVALGTPFALVTMVGSAVLKGLQFYDIVNRVTITAGVFNSLLGALLVTFEYGVLALAFLDFVFAVVTAVVFLLLSMRSVHESIFQVKFKSGLFKDLLSFGGHLTVLKVATRTAVYLPRFVLASVVGSTAVTYYEVGDKVVRALHGFHTHATTVLLPVASQLSVSEESKEDFVDSYLSFSRYAVLMAIPFFSILLALSPAVLELWVGTELAKKGTDALRLLTLAYLVNSFTNVPTRFALGANRARLVAGYGIVLLAITGGAAVPFVTWFGVVGAALAVFTGRATATVLFLGLYHWILRVTFGRFWKKVVRFPVIAAAVTAGAGYGLYLSSGAIALLAVAIGAVSLGAYFGLAWRYADIPLQYKQKVIDVLSPA